MLTNLINNLKINSMTEFNSKIKQNSRILKIFLFSICALFACAINAHAQSLVQGTVTDETGESLPGVSVVVKGTTNGTVTDVNGKYSIQATSKDILSFTYVGMAEQDIKVAGQKTINVVMKDDVASLDEVIVVGYGTAKKQSLTGAVSAVKGDELLKAPATNVSSLLGGRLPGISSVQVSGEPGDDQAVLRVRGSIYNVTYIVDGMPRSINDIDPNDIESVSVLKDGASAAVYGLKGAGGVIIVTTKRGQEGKSRITYNGSIGASMNANFPQFMNGPQFAYYYNMADMMDKLANGSITDMKQYTPVFTKANVEAMLNGDPTDGWDNVNYIDKVFGTGINQKHNITVQGGSDKMRYFTSVGYLGQTGILPNADRQQFNARTNLDLKLNSRLTVRLNLAYIKNDYSDPISSYASGISETGDPNSAASSDQIIRQLNRIAPWIVGRAEDGTYGTIGDGNPLAWLDVNQTVDRKNQNFSGTLSADYKIIDGLVATVTGSYVNNQQHYRAFQKYIQYNPNKETEPNRLEERFTGWHRANFDALLNFDRQFGEHGLKAMAGWHTEKYDYTYNQQFRKNFPTNDLTDIAAGDAATQKNNGYTRELAMISSE